MLDLCSAGRFLEPWEIDRLRSFQLVRAQSKFLLMDIKSALYELQYLQDTAISAEEEVLISEEVFIGRYRLKCLQNEFPDWYKDVRAAAINGLDYTWVPSWVLLNGVHPEFRFL